MKTKLLGVLLTTLLGTSTQAKADNWMANLPDGTYVSHLSIPGTHDSATGNGFTVSLSASFAKTQDLNIAEQWSMGIRAFDLRPSTRDGYLQINHGIAETKLRFDDAIHQLRDSLIANPSEFIVIHLLHETDGDKDGTSDNYTSLLLDVLQADDMAGYLADFRRDLTVKQMRGKILILSRNKYAGTPIGGFMSNWCGYVDWAAQTKGVITGKGTGTYAKASLYMQDFSDTHEDGAVDTKVEAIKKLLDYTTTHRSSSKSSLVWAYNFASAYNTSISTANGYRDNATYTNAAFIEYLQTHTAGPTGIVLMDYAGVDKSNGYATRGKELIDTLIANNFKYLQYVPTAIEGIAAEEPQDDEPEIYSVSGTRLNAPQAGAINIIRHKNGKVEKVKY